MELIVVIAILGFLTALVAPGVSRFLAGSRAQAYNASQERIHKAVDAFYSDPANVGFIGPSPSTRYSAQRRYTASSFGRTAT